MQNKMTLGAKGREESRARLWGQNGRHGRKEELIRKEGYHRRPTKGLLVGRSSRRMEERLLDKWEDKSLGAYWKAKEKTEQALLRP